jgi:cytochrome c oxidase cbb3-type subunit I/II
MQTLVTLGVPYSEEEIENAQEQMLKQGAEIEKNLYNDPDFVKSYEADRARAEAQGLEFVEMKNREIVALIAYLQRLGTDIKVNKTQEASASK